MMRVPNSNAPLTSIPTGGTAAGAARQYSTNLGAPMQPSTNAVGAFNRGAEFWKPITDGVADVAKAGSEIIQKKLQEEAETLADNAYANIGQDLNEHLHGENGMYSRKGVNAFNAEADTVQFFDKSLAQYGKDMNDATRKLLSARVAQLRPGIQSEVSRYEGGERREALFEANKSAMALDLDVIAKNYKDARIVGEAWGRIDQGAEKMIELNGWGPEQAQLHRQKVDSEILSGLAGKFIEAKEYGEAWKLLNDPRIRPADKTKAMEAYSESMVKEAEANAKADPRAAAQLLALAQERLAEGAETGEGVNAKRGERLPASAKDLATRAAEQAGIDPALALAVCAAESNGKTDAVSPKGARGLFQLMPSTQRDLEKKYGIDGSTPEGNARLGALYLKEKLEHYNGNQHLALAAYNWGEGHVDSWLKTGRGLPTKEYKNGTGLPAETKNYVTKILGSAPSRSGDDSGAGPAQTSAPSPDDPYSPLGKPQWVAIEATASAALKNHRKAQVQQDFLAAYQPAWEASKDLPENARDFYMTETALKISDPAVREEFLSTFKHDSELFKIRQDAIDSELRVKALKDIEGKPRTEALQHIDVLRDAGMSEDALTSLKKEIFEGPVYTDPYALDVINLGILRGSYDSPGDLRKAMDDKNINTKDRDELFSLHKSMQNHAGSGFKSAVDNITNNLDAFGIPKEDHAKFLFSFNNAVELKKQELGRNPTSGELQELARRMTVQAITGKGFGGRTQQEQSYKALTVIPLEAQKLITAKLRNAGHKQITPEMIVYEYNRPENVMFRERFAVAPLERPSEENDAEPGFMY